MPLTGGPTDKVGNRYERRWTVFTLVDLLEGRAQSIRIEVPGDEGTGAEFRVKAGGVPFWHQVKRQRDGGPWTIASLANESVLAPWWPKIQQGGRCVFVSSTGAQELRELVERAQDAETWTEFDTIFLEAEAQRSRFERLCVAWQNSAGEAVYLALRHIQVRLIGETELVDWLDARLAALVTGQPSTAAAVLERFVDDALHREVTGSDVWQRLAEAEIMPRNLSSNNAVIQRIAAGATSYVSRLRRLHINGHYLHREEADAAFTALTNGRRVLIAGAAGSGKSVIAGQVTELARQAGWTAFALAVDRMPDTASTHALGNALLGHEDSPVTLLAGVASGAGEALLVLDQLDTVSVVSGRHPERLAIIEDLLAEADRHPRLRVLICCRQFDLDNDRQLRAVTSDDRTTVVPVALLDESVVRKIAVDVGVAEHLPNALVALLTTPLHLAIYVDLVRAGNNDLSAVRNLTELYDRYWVVKREACRAIRRGADEWLIVIDRIVERMSGRQQLTVPTAVMDDLDTQINVMASEGVLVIENDLVSFFHETFFDYCFARRFVAQGGTLRELLDNGEQGLFRRAQVRQVLTYERSTEFSNYIADFTWILTAPTVRLHLKALIVSLVQTVNDPHADEWAVLLDIAEDSGEPLHGRLWPALRRNGAWFEILNAAGAWAAWLRSPDVSVVNRTLWALAGMTGWCAGEIADLVNTLPRDDAWPNRVRGFIFQAESLAHPKLLDVLLGAINDGHYDGARLEDFWYSLQRLVNQRPAFAVKAVSILFDRVFANDLGNPLGKDGPLPGGRRSGTAGRTLQIMAAKAPVDFSLQLVPYILETARRTSKADVDEDGLLFDAVWRWRLYDVRTSLADDLLGEMCKALQVMALTDPDSAARVFDELRSDPHETSWFLVAHGYAGSPERFADAAASWLSTTTGALNLGYANASHWTSRELIQAVTPHCSELQFEGVVDAVLAHVPQYERTYEGLRSRGYAQLCLLNAIDSARRPNRVNRRLAELRRKFQAEDVGPPFGMRAGAVAPPIPEDRARKMSDRQWIRAMTRHGISDVRFVRDGEVVGDASVQAQVLEAVVRDAPARFAKLFLRLPLDIAPPYVEALLRGLTGSHLDVSLLQSVCQHAFLISGIHEGRVANLIQSHAEMTLPDLLLDIVADMAMRRPEGPPASGSESIQGESDSTASRCDAAAAIGALIAQHHNRLETFKESLAHLSTDPSVAVREMAVTAFTAILAIDPTLASELFQVAAADAGDEFLASYYVEYFLNWSIRRGKYAHIADILGRMSASATRRVSETGARQLAVASYQHPDLDVLVDTLMANNENTRAIIVKVFSDNVIATTRRDRAFGILARAFDDSSSAVRSAAATCFFGLEKQNLSDYVPLLDAFGRSAAMQGDVSAVFHVLESSRQPLPAAVLELCERFVTLHHSSVGDIATAAAGASIFVSQLVVRLHAQHAIPDIRRRCLDLIDQLVVAGAQGVDDHLEQIER